MSMFYSSKVKVNVKTASTKLRMAYSWLLVIRHLIVLHRFKLNTESFESFEGSCSDVGEGGVAVHCEKTQFFLNTLYLLTKQIT